MVENSRHFIFLGAILIVILGLFVLNLSPLKDEGTADIKPTAANEETQELDQAFAPHKALYEIRLVSTKSGSQVMNIAGQMLYEWKPLCEAWSSNHRFNIRYEYADTPPLNMTSDFSTYESFDGTSLSFTSQRKRDGEMFEELRGQANIENNQEGEAVFTIPEDLVHQLPVGTRFPVGHTMDVAQKIKEGKTFYNSVIYDGSDEKGAIEVNAFIGKEVNALSRIQESADLDISLINTPARLVRLAFFPISENEESSDYEMDLVFHNNGVISDMLIDYDDFSVSQRLIAIEKIDGGCADGSESLEGEELEQNE